MVQRGPSLFTHIIPQLPPSPQTADSTKLHLQNFSVHKKQTSMAAASQLTILAPKPRALQTFRPIASCSTLNTTPATTNFRKQIMGFAAGLLAATAVAATAPLAADATRIEYYATVSDPPCQLNFVKSGLGYCDVMVGSGEEVPFAQLINVSFFISQDLTFF